jgi:predicted amidohydrolase
MRAAAVQVNSTEDKERNLESADRLTRAAAGDGAELVVLPEKFNVLGTHEDYLAGAETLDGPTIGWARDTARELGIDLVAGSIVERREGREKLSNTSVHVGPDGEVKAVYRKIHMFDVEVGGQVYRESDSEEPGEEGVLSELAAGQRLGLTVCYDLRFPELYRLLAVEGARVVTLPAAFTKVTGRAHWEILVRARAIEDQVFVVAADQIGRHPPDKESFGGSMIVDPWGEVLARAPDEPSFVAAELDFARQDEVREKLPSLANRQASAYVLGAPH